MVIVSLPENMSSKYAPRMGMCANLELRAIPQLSLKTFVSNSPQVLYQANTQDLEIKNNCLCLLFLLLLETKKYKCECLRIPSAGYYVTVSHVK